MKQSLGRLEDLYDTKLFKAILLKNNMPDRVLSLILEGLKARPEFYSLQSTLNEIGPLSAK